MEPLTRFALAALVLVGWSGDVASATLAGGEPLTAAFARDLVEEELLAQGAGPLFEVRIDQPQLPLGNTATADTEIVLEDLRHQPASGRFEGELVGRIEGKERFRLAVHGRAPELLELPTPSRLIDPGEIIVSGDLSWRTVRANRVAPTALTELDQLVGAEARRRLRPGSTLTGRDVGPPRLVRRGRPVRLVYVRPGLRLEVLGTAQDDGPLGAMVQVVNVDSRRQLQGVVSGPDEVTLGPMPPATTAERGTP